MGTRLSYEQVGCGRRGKVRLSLNDMVITFSQRHRFRGDHGGVTCALSIMEDGVDGIVARTRGWEVVNESVFSRDSPTMSPSSSSSSSATPSTPTALVVGCVTAHSLNANLANLIRDKLTIQAPASPPDTGPIYPVFPWHIDSSNDLNHGGKSRYHDEL